MCTRTWQTPLRNLEKHLYHFRIQFEQSQNLSKFPSRFPSGLRDYVFATSAEFATTLTRRETTHSVRIVSGSAGLHAAREQWLLRFFDTVLPRTDPDRAAAAQMCAL